MGAAYAAQSFGLTGTEEIGPLGAGTAEEINELLLGMDDEALNDVYLRDANVGQVIVLVKDEGSLVLSPLMARVEHRLETHPPPASQAKTTGTVKLTTILWDRLFSSI